MQIDQTLERSFLAAGEEPVDRTLFVGLEVIFLEVCEEVLAQPFAERFLDEVKISL